MNNKGFFYLAPVLVILALGLVLLPKSKHTRELNPRHLLLEINDQTRFVSPDEVAAAIINKDPFYQLVDVRTPAEFQSFSLTHAVNIPLADVLNTENKEILDQTSRRIIFFSNNDIYAEQAWMLCRRQGFRNLFVLKGGLNAWMSTIINPSEPPVTASKEEFEQYEFRKGASQFFVGTGEVNLPDKAAEKPKAKVKIAPVAKPAAAEGGC